MLIISDELARLLTALFHLSEIAARVVEHFCQTNGQILLPVVNLIKSPQEARPSNRQRHALAQSEDGERWVASDRLLTEKHFRKIDGHRDLRKAHPDELYG